MDKTSVVRASTLLTILFLALTMMSSYRIRYTTQREAPSWLKEGFSATYMGNVTLESQIMEASVTWKIRRIDNGVAVIEERVESDLLRYPLTRVFQVDVDTGELLKLDNESVGGMKAFFWVDPSLEPGERVEIEGVVYTVSKLEEVNASQRVWKCLVVNASVDEPGIRGVVTRWYDSETGIQVKVYMNLDVAYPFKGVNQTVSAVAHLLILKVS